MEIMLSTQTKRENGPKQLVSRKINNRKTRKRNRI